MRYVHDIIRERLLRHISSQIPVTLKHVAKKQWSARFERLMRNRLIFGYFRYGDLRSEQRRLTPYDNIGSAITRLQSYLADGNQEHLVDAANLCMVEFIVPTCHPSPSLNSIDDGQHTKIK